MKRLAPKRDENMDQLVSKRQLQFMGNALLNAENVNPKMLNNFVELLDSSDSRVPAGEVMNTLEVIFKNLLKRQTAEANEKQSQQIIQLYEKTWSSLIGNLLEDSQCAVALKVCMQLIKVEAKHPIGPKKGWPTHRIQQILETFLNADETPTNSLTNYGKYCKNLDVLEITLKKLSDLVPKENFKDIPIKAMTFLSIVNLLDMGKSVLNTADYHVESAKNQKFNLEQNGKRLSNLWLIIMSKGSEVDEKLHRQILMVLLERVINHLEDPIQLTDFLMDSLHQFDGPIALLALQGIFTLMQKQNITYPDVYEKLYNMFYPRMFFNKYKARLFYLADIFLTSTHLPENLVAAFVKRLARLALQSPTEDAVIMIRFVCNLLLRHTGLQKLIRGSNAADEISDPYNETETDPVKSDAINSSLWEITLLQKHVVPEVANAARFINSSLPIMEFDLAPLLDRKECNIFDDELQSKAKQFALNYERPANLALPKNDYVTKYWELI
ncbi:nucleolar complex protein 4 homolog B [Drosophila eugracilis]|uniref:nucleolar complex protein 4 homolog B n=1 Tax=Drosophila eugracilis TaxID=29029 RepID=UPI0007E795B7|nr:nucleolar complex protein 4 homolog B [Drosophila eugracilis]